MARNPCSISKKKALIHVEAIEQKFSHVYSKNTDLPFMFAVSINNKRHTYTHTRIHTHTHMYTYNTRVSWRGEFHFLILSWIYHSTFARIHDTGLKNLGKKNASGLRDFLYDLWTNNEIIRLRQVTFEKYLTKYIVYASRFFKPVDIYLIPFFFCFLLSLNKFEKETLQFFNQDLFIYLFITRNSTHDGQLHRLLTYNNLKEWHYLVRACVRRAYHRSDRTALRESMRWR